MALIFGLNSWPDFFTMPVMNQRDMHQFYETSPCSLGGVLFDGDLWKAIPGSPFK